MEARFETFTVLVNRINRNIRKIKNTKMARYNLRNSHISCLYYLYSSKGLTAGELCDKCEEDKATISRSLAFLNKEGYLIFEEQNTKKYKAPIVLTEKGIKAGKKISEEIDNVLEEVSTGMTQSDREAFYRFLGIISNNLDKIEAGFSCIEN